MYIYYFLDQEEVAPRHFQRISDKAALCTSKIKEYGEVIDHADGAMVLTYQTENDSIFVRDTSAARVVRKIVSEMKALGLKISLLPA